MKVLLIKPINYQDQIVPSLGLGYLATAIKNNAEVIIEDLNRNGLGYKGFASLIKDMKPDILGIQMFSRDYSSVKEHLKITKNVNPEIITILGGPHPSGAPQETLQDIHQSDFLLMGEAEKGLAMVIEAIKQGDISTSILKKIPSLCWRDGDEIIMNDIERCQDLDSLGFPEWELIKPQHYGAAVHGFFLKNYPAAPILGTRGCPFPCNFCAGPTILGKKVRFRSVGNIIEEINLLVKTYGIREILIEDDNFTLRKDFAMDFCEQLKRQDLNISFCFPNGVRLDTLDKELLEELKSAGCYEVAVGIESGSQKILDDMKKKITIELVREKVSLINSVGLGVVGFFILGYPKETTEDIKKTIDLACSLKLKRAGFGCFLPLPGSPIYNELRASGELDNVSWSDYFWAQVPYSPRGISKDKLKKLQRKAHIKFYLNPRVIFGMAREIKTSEHIKYIAKRAVSIMLSK